MASGYFFCSTYLSPLARYSRLATSGSFEQAAHSAKQQTVMTNLKRLIRDVSFKAPSDRGLTANPSPAVPIGRNVANLFTRNRITVSSAEPSQDHGPEVFRLEDICRWA